MKEYSKSAERYDLYSLIGCHQKESRDKIKKASITLLKLFHPDKLNSNEFDSQYFLLINYTYKILDNPITKYIYDYEGHRGLKIYFNKYNDYFESILKEYPSNLINIESEELEELLIRIIKKIRKIKFELMKINFHKYTRSELHIENSYDLSEYMNNAIDESNYNIKIKKTRFDLNKKNTRKFRTNKEYDYNSNYIQYNSLENNKNYDNDKIIVNSNDSIKVHDIKFTYIIHTLFKKSNNKLSLIINTNYNLSRKFVSIFPELHIKYILSNNLATKYQLIPEKNKVKLNINNFEYLHYSKKNYSILFLLTLFPHPYIKSYLDYRERKFTVKFGNTWRSDYMSLKAFINIFDKKLGIIGSLPLNDDYNSQISLHTDIFKLFHLKYKGKLSKGLNFQVLFY